MALDHDVLLSEPPIHSPVEQGRGLDPFHPGAPIPHSPVRAGHADARAEGAYPLSSLRPSLLPLSPLSSRPAGRIAPTDHTSHVLTSSQQGAIRPRVLVLPTCMSEGVDS